MMRAVRGATTVDSDTQAAVHESVGALVEQMLTRNQIAKEDIVSIIFTATEDVTSAFPAAAARAYGLGDVPLLCAREMSVVAGTPRCIRVLMHAYTDHPRSELRHVYLEGAKGLRDDLPG